MHIMSYDNTIIIISMYEIDCLQALIIIPITVDLSVGRWISFGCRKL